MAIRADDVDLRRDAALVERFQAGDVAGFEDLYRRYYRRLLRFCLKRVGDTQEAEELTQEAFTRAYAAMPRLAGERRFYPWLSVIAARLCADTHRRRARSEVRPEIDTGVIDSGHEHLFAAVDHQLVHTALDRLGPRHREVLRLREEQGWSYQRIADHFEVSLGAVEQLLWRARRALRREFEVVAGTDGRPAALPVVGWLARKLAGLRARLGDLATQAAPAVANATVALAIVAGSAATSPAGGTTVPSAPATSAPAVDAVEIVATQPPTNAGSPTAPSSLPPPPAPTPQSLPDQTPVAPVAESLGVMSEDEAREQADGNPINVETPMAWISANPGLIVDAAANRVGGSQ